MTAIGFKPLSPTWGCFLGCSVPHIVQQLKIVCHAALTRHKLHIFDMIAAPPTLMKQKNPVLPFSGRMRPFWQKILVPSVG